jgi:hypothetical protein
MIRAACRSVIFALGQRLQSCPVGRDGGFEVVHASAVLDDRHAITVPNVNPKWEVRLRVHVGSPQPEKSLRWTIPLMWRTVYL